MIPSISPQPPPEVSIPKVGSHIHSSINLPTHPPFPIPFTEDTMCIEVQPVWLSCTHPTGSPDFRPCTRPNQREPISRASQLPPHPIPRYSRVTAQRAPRYIQLPKPRLWTEHRHVPRPRGRVSRLRPATKHGTVIADSNAWLVRLAVGRRCGWCHLWQSAFSLGLTRSEWRVVGAKRCC